MQPCALLPLHELANAALQTRRGAHTEDNAPEDTSNAVPDAQEATEQPEPASDGAMQAATNGADPAPGAADIAEELEAHEPATGAQEAALDEPVAEVPSADASAEEVAVVGAEEQDNADDATANAADSDMPNADAAVALERAVPASATAPQRRSRSPDSDNEQNAKRLRTDGTASASQADPDDPMQQPPHGTEVRWSQHCAV